jgi:hypothetical protein
LIKFGPWGKFGSNLVVLRFTVVSACGNLALVAVLYLIPSCNMPTATNAILDHVIGPVTAEDEAEFDREYGGAREDVEEVPVPPKKKTWGPGKKNSA